MPPLQRSVLRKISLPVRQGQLIAEADVLVVGGGPSGIGAAVGAAKAGASVVLVERYGFLGGSATAALVVTLASYHTSGPKPEKAEASLFFPADHGPGKPVIGGVLGDFVERMVRKGGALAPSQKTGYIVPFDPEIFKLVALEMLDETGVNFLFHSFASGVFSEGTGKAVIFETKSGPVVVKAKVIIDCTGDADIAAAAGARYESGREEDSLTEPMTLMFIMSGFNKSRFAEYVEEHPGQWKGVFGLPELVQKATAEGKLELPRENILLFGTPHEQDISVNSTRITRVLGTDIWDLAYAEWAGRRQMAQIAEFLKKYVPGFEQAYLAQSGTEVSVRETRRIIGEYHITADDVLSARKFDDVIARGAYPVDMHSPTGKGTVLKRLPQDEAYDIPLRALIPADIDGILIAGRSISGSHEAQSSYRVMPISIATGQAAGACAALAARQSKPPRLVRASEVQAELLKQGANLGERVPSRV